MLALELRQSTRDRPAVDLHARAEFERCQSWPTSDRLEHSELLAAEVARCRDGGRRFVAGRWIQVTRTRALGQRHDGRRAQEVELKAATFGTSLLRSHVCRSGGFGRL